MTTLDDLIAEATASGGSERANYQLFISGLCDVLGVPRPAMSQETNARNDYVFERSLDYRHPDGSSTKLYVDCYKRGSFVLEAKQSARRQAEDQRTADLFGSEAHSRKLGHARRGSRGWDRVMRAGTRLPALKSNRGPEDVAESYRPPVKTAHDPVAVVEQCRTKSYKRKDGVLDIVGLADTAQRKRPG